MSNLVGGVDSSQAFTGVSGTSFKDHMRKVMEPVAGALGVSTDQLDTELSSGKSLSEVAAAKGASRDDLLAAIKKGLQSADADSGSTTDSTTAASTATDASATTTSRLDTLAARIAGHKRHHGHHGHGHRHGVPPAAATASTTQQSSSVDLLQSGGTPSGGLSSQSDASLLSGRKVDVQA